MLQLPNNCRAGNFSVRPANWKAPSANWKSLWRISYWFFDDNSGKKIKVVIKGMNRLRSLKDKQDYTRELINYEMDLLQTRGWNYVTRSFSPVSESTAEIDENTLFLPALDYAFTRLQVEHATLLDIKSCLKYIKEAAIALKYDQYRIVDIRRKQIKLILEKCGDMKTMWSSNTYNHYRKYLSVLFKELLEIDVIDSNPIRDIQKKKTVHRMREQLTKKERELLRSALKPTQPRFWRFLNIFFHSGSRPIELLRIKKHAVDLINQRFKVLTKKGRNPREEWRLIKDVALGDWKELMEIAGSDDYLFSTDFVPGPKMIPRKQASDFWKEHIKDKLGITADMYSLKASNLDETAEALTKHREAVKEASEFAGHSTPVVTMKHYLHGELVRQGNTIKEVRNEL